MKTLVTGEMAVFISFRTLEGSFYEQLLAELGL
jgi:hypothetical protein